MALPRFTNAMDFISKLSNRPNDAGSDGLTGAELKALFDAGPEAIKDYINNTLIPQIESDIEAAALGVGVGGAINGSSLADNSVPGAKLTDKAVTEPKLADSAVSARSIADSAVGTEKLADNAVTSDKIADSAVKSAQINDGAVNADKLFAGAVTETKLGLGAVSTRATADGAITEPKIAAGAVSTNYSAAIPTTAWTGSAAPYTATVTVSGVLASDTPIIDLVASASFATAEQEIEAWGRVYRATTAANSVTFYATEKPTVALNVQLKAVRK